MKGLSISSGEASDLSKLLAELPACRYTNSDPIDAVLAMGCLLYQSYYLYPTHLPTALDGYQTIEEYVTFLEKTDPFTYYIPPATFTQTVAPTLAGERATIGIVLQIKNADATSSKNRITAQTPLEIRQVLPYSRGWLDGLQDGDLITAINQVSVAGLTMTEAIAKLPKTEASAVVLTVERGTSTLDVSTAAEMHISKILEGNIAYLNIREFTGVTGDLVRADYDALVQQSGAPFTQIILDLRHNLGGRTDAARAIVDYFINQDTPVNTQRSMSTQNRAQQKTDFYLGESPYNIGNFTKENFVVLMDGESASSSEIVINALKHYETATAIGQVTYGKGVQQVFGQIFNQGGLFVTSDSILDPAGVSHHLVGIKPDYCVTVSDTDATREGTQYPVLAQDPQLANAVSWLRSGTVQTVGTCDLKAARTLDRQRPDPENPMVTSCFLV